MVPEASWLMVTSTPAMGAPLASTTWPLTPAEVLCANAGAAASTAIMASDSLDSRARLRWVISNTSRKAGRWMAFGRTSALADIRDTGCDGGFQGLFPNPGGTRWG